MNCWILQCNINHYRWLDSMILHKKDLDTWGIRHHILHVQEGDTAFIWLTQYKGEKTQGIYAVAEITGLPDIKRKKFAWAKLYWIAPEAEKEFPFNLELRYTKLIICKPILKDELEEADLAHLLTVERYPRNIYKLSPKDCAIIKKLVEAREGYRKN